MTELQRILTVLRREGMEVESVEDGAFVKEGDSSVALEAEEAEGGGVIVRLHVDLNLYVDEDALPDVLLGLNLMNQNLDYGTLVLEPVDDEDEDELLPSSLADNVSFTIVGRSVLWLSDLDESELLRLREHLGRFEREVNDAVEHTLHGEKGIRA